LSTVDAFDRGVLSPGTAGADALVDDAAVVRALTQVEVALLEVLAAVGIAPDSAAPALRDALERPVDAGALAAEALASGNPVIPLVAELRDRVAQRDVDAACWVHRGATSQDVLDTALMIVAARALDDAVPRVGAAASAAAGLADRHRRTLMAGRTLTQHSTPIVFGAVAAQWALGLADAASGLRAAREGLPVQLGGASGNLAALVELGGAPTATRLPELLADRLGLRPSLPWHVRRGPVTALGDAIVTAVDAAGVVAADVALLSRPEIAELAEGTTGGSSTMPQKRNPVASVLLRSLAQRAPGLAAELHRSAGASVDQRPDGAWHAEWPALRELLRIGLGSAQLIERLTAGLQVDVERMSRTLRDAGPALLSERIAITDGPAAAAALLADPARASSPLLDPGGYLGLSDRIIDEAIARTT
jgi:3-carboxy-cis,cis-muconate cycloisomerase